MAFGQAVSNSLFEQIIRGCEVPTSTVEPGITSPPRLVRQRAIGADPPPGLPHTLPSPPTTTSLPELPSIVPNPFLNMPAPIDLPAHMAIPPLDDTPPALTRQSAGEPLPPSMGLQECVRVMNLVFQHTTVHTGTMRTLSLQALARSLDEHALLAPTSTRMNTIMTCAKAIRELSTVPTIDDTVSRIITQEIATLLSHTP